uniref:Methane monooxygenase protein A1 n=1 Tax=Methylococcaceae bacterium ET-HIRO TaxID=557143 RepID=B9X094_9GAMM|nr:methane monooxygenase protein A1 [Methylococcaceae bacterium ET-HIRO]
MSIGTSELKLLKALDRPGSSARRTSRVLDFLIIPVVVCAVIAATHIHIMLTVGDWDFWVDWKDRLYWITLTPVLLVIIPAGLSYVFWERFRLPIAGTLCAVCLLLGEWANRYFGFHLWSYFPFSMVWPAIAIPGLMVMDLVLMLTRNIVITSIFGGGAVAMLFAAGNWPLLAPFRVPVEHLGQLVSMADFIGYTYIRTATPEYLRMVERGTLRTFGGESTAVSSFFAAFLCMIMYYIWWSIGKKLAGLGYMPNQLKQFMGYKKDEMEVK